jgi:hypothetical protein
MPEMDRTLDNGIPIKVFSEGLEGLKWFQSLRSGSSARRKPMKKRSIHGSM